VRRFRKEALDRETITALIQAAISAPSASNQQPWRFLAVSGPRKIAALADAVRAAVERLGPHLAPSFRASLAGYAESFTRFSEAPVVLVVLYRPTAVLSRLVDEALPAEDRALIEALEHGSALTSASLALGQLLLAAHARGLGACCMTGPLLAEREARALLSIPPSWQVAAFVPLGFPAEEPAPTPRKSVDLVLRFVEDEDS
jgi:nitroreductase